MSTQGETSKRGSWIAATISGVAIAAVLGVGGFALVKSNLDAQAHTALMVEVKADGKTLNAAATEDAALAATAVEAGQITHIQAVAAEQVAVKVAAEEAAAAEAARVAAEQAAVQAAAQQAAPKQVARQQAASAGPTLCPPGTSPNAVDASGNESNCQANGPSGEVCTAYDANNNCTNWYKP